VRQDSGGGSLTSSASVSDSTLVLPSLLSGGCANARCTSESGCNMARKLSRMSKSKVFNEKAKPSPSSRSSRSPSSYSDILSRRLSNNEGKAEEVSLFISGLVTSSSRDRWFRPPSINHLKAISTSATRWAEGI